MVAPLSDTVSVQEIGNELDVREIGLRQAKIQDPARLTALHATGLLDSEVEEVFDRLTRIAVRLLGVPAAFISLVDADRDFYKSACGFGEPLAGERQIAGPTFCHYTVQRTTPLVIPDTAGDPEYRNVPTVKTLGVAAYVGVPLTVDGQTIGAFCAIDTHPRKWTGDEVDTLVELAASAQREVELRAAVSRAQTALSELESSRRELEERTEQAETANKAKSGFLSMMSHELRTPLNAITGYADILTMGVKGPVNEGQLDYLERILKASRHLQGLIGDVLEFARIDARSVNYSVDTVIIDDVIHDAVELVSPLMAEREITFTRENGESPERDVGYRAYADADRVRQILINLLANAIKFSPKGGRVWATRHLRKDFVGIGIGDRGRGIPPDLLHSVFEPFVQIDRESTAAKFQGVGLGLAICRELALGMRGDLGVESTEGVGSTFTLWLPTR